MGAEADTNHVVVNAPAHDLSDSDSERPGTSATKTSSSSRPPPLYGQGDMILLVGEGNFSFAAALLQRFQNRAFIVATVFDNAKVVRSKYPDARRNAKSLTASG